MVEKIEQFHRVQAAAKVAAGPKAEAVKASILAGKSDDHPLVQAAAFYSEKKE